MDNNDARKDTHIYTYMYIYVRVCVYIYIHSIDIEKGSINDWAFNPSSASMRRRINDSTRFPYDPVSRFVRSTTIDAPCPASIGGTRDWFFVDRCRHAAKSPTLPVATSLPVVVTLLRHATFAVIYHNLRSVDDALGGLIARVNKRHVNASGFLNVPCLSTIAAVRKSRSTLAR